MSDRGIRAQRWRNLQSSADARQLRNPANTRDWPFPAGAHAHLAIPAHARGTGARARPEETRADGDRIGQPDGYAVVGEPERALIADEIADVLMLGLVLANHLGIDVEAELRRKLAVIDARLRAGHRR